MDRFEQVPGLRYLRSISRGDPRIVIAILDGPVDVDHACLSGAALEVISASSPGRSGTPASMQHGTHVVSQIFAGHVGALDGIAPKCRGLLIPVFCGDAEGGLTATSQVDLARAIRLAVDRGAHIINISGGQLSPTPEANQFLVDAVAYCEQNGVLIVAAAGNNGCDCLHVPASIAPVLAVGALDPGTGKPLGLSNWGSEYRNNGILAPGKDIAGARSGGGLTTGTGTSFAAPIVTGVAALLISVQLERGQPANAAAVRTAILAGARRCDEASVGDCRAYLVGTLDVQASLAALTAEAGRSNLTNAKTLPGVGVSGFTTSRFDHITQSGTTMTNEQIENESNAGVTSEPRAPAGVEASGCGCGGAAPAAAPQLVFALGEIGYDLASEARKDSLYQAMQGNPYDWKNLIRHLASHPWDAEAVTWTLRMDATPIYVIRPAGAYAVACYEHLAKMLIGQLSDSSRKIERVSIPGMVAGTTRLSNGISVPMIIPSLRGMYAWDTASLVAAAKKDEHTDTSGLTNFLERVYHALRNLGQSPRERAINFAATNAFQVERIFHDAANKQHELDLIEVEKSPICRQDSDCWDVKLTFFDPKNDRAARQVHRFTIDVSDVVPCTVGRIRSWSVR